MSISMKKLTHAEQVRQAVRLERTRRGSALAMSDLPPPSIDDRVFADKSDGTLYSIFLGVGVTLSLEIPRWNLSARGQDKLTVYKLGDGQQVLFEDVFNAADSARFPLKVDIPYEVFNRWGDGPHEFVYDVVQANNEYMNSLPLLLRFDREAPYKGNPPSPFPEVGPVLESNIGAVTVALPAYPDWQEGDHVAYFWLNLAEPPEDLNDLEPVAFVKVESPPQALVVPEAYIREAGNGGIYAIYQLFDKAGNASFPSVYRAIGVALGTLPDNLQPPRVPLAPGGQDTLIDVADALLGVTVEIDAFDHFDAEDEINVTWGTAPLGWDRIGARRFPLEVAVPNEVLREQYGMTTKGDKRTTVKYEVRRGTVPQGSREIEILVNFETVAPDPGTDPIPEFPEPVNPRLPLPDVFGEGSTTPNQLEPEHEEKPAELRVVLYDDIKDGDKLEFYWGEQRITEATYDIDQDSDNSGDEIRRPVPWPYIKGGNNGVVPVHYTVTRPDVPNIGLSDNQNVTVDAITITPAAPDYERGPTAPEGWVNCSSLYENPEDPQPLEPAIRIVVPDLSEYELQAGDVVTMHWQAFQGAADTYLPDADKIEPITLGGDYPVTGFTWYVQPYDDHILPIYVPGDATGSAKITYAFEYQGKQVTSEVLDIIVGMYTPIGSCPIPPTRK